MGEFFKPSERINYGITLLLAVLAVVIDKPILWDIVVIIGLTLVFEPFLNRRFKMTPAVTLGAVCVVGLFVAAIWQLVIYGPHWGDLNSRQSADEPGLHMAIERVQFDPNGPTEFHLDFRLWNNGPPSIIKDFSASIFDNGHAILENFPPRVTWPPYAVGPSGKPTPAENLSQKPLETGGERKLHFTFTYTGNAIADLGIPGAVFRFTGHDINGREISATHTIQEGDLFHPGLGAYAFLQLYDTPEKTRRYVFEAETKEHAVASFYLSASEQFTFAVTDTNGETYAITANVGGDGIPVGRLVALFCEAGNKENSAFLRIRNGNRIVAFRELSAPIPLGSLDWKAGSLGKPALGSGEGDPMLLLEVGFWPFTFTDRNISDLTTNARSAYQKQF